MLSPISPPAIQTLLALLLPCRPPTPSPNKPAPKTLIHHRRRHQKPPTPTPKTTTTTTITDITDTHHLHPQDPKYITPRPAPPQRRPMTMRAWQERNIASLTAIIIAEAKLLDGWEGEEEEREREGRLGWFLDRREEMVGFLRGFGGDGIRE